MSCYNCVFWKFCPEENEHSNITEDETERIYSADYSRKSSNEKVDEKLNYNTHSRTPTLSISEFNLDSTRSFTARSNPFSSCQNLSNERYFEINRAIRNINLKEIINGVCKVSFTRVLRSDYIPSPRNIVSHENSFAKSQKNIEVLYDDACDIKSRIKGNKIIAVSVLIVCFIILYILT